MANVVGQDENISETDDVFFVELQRDQTKRYKSKELRTITSDFSKHLGSGSFGDVFKGTLEDGVEVAVKVLRETTQSLSDMIKVQFKAEVSTLCKTNHRNLVHLYGYCFEPDKKALVYEFTENGSLDSVLYKNQNLKWEMLWNIAIGTANGLSYLHEGCQPSIIHYDIKPSNILLDSKFSPKIGDFGLAKLLNTNITHVTVSGYRGTESYAAPELSHPYFLSKTTPKCDVFSYGKFLFDLVSRRCRGHDKDSFYTQVEMFVNGQEGKLMKDYGIEKQNIEKAKKILKLALWCLEYWPQDRPSMRDVLIFLEGRELEIPTNSFSGTTRTTSLTSQYLEASSVSLPINNLLAIANLDTGSASSIIQNMRLASLNKEINGNWFASPKLENEVVPEIVKTYKGTETTSSISRPYSLNEEPNRNQFATPELENELETEILIPHEDTGSESKISQHMRVSSSSEKTNRNQFAAPELEDELETKILIPREDIGSESSISQYTGVSSLSEKTNRNQFATPELENELDADILKPYGEKKKVVGWSYFNGIYQKPLSKSQNRPPASTVVLKIRLHCEGCCKKIRKIISEYKGVYDVKIDIHMDLVTVHGVMDVSTLVPFLKQKVKGNVKNVPPKKGDHALRGGCEVVDHYLGKKVGRDEGEKKVDSEIDVTKELVAAKGVKTLQPSLEKEFKRKVEIVPSKKQHERKQAGGDDGEKKAGVNVEGDKKADDVGQKAKGGHGGEKKPSGKVEALEVNKMEYYYGYDEALELLRLEVNQMEYNYGSSYDTYPPPPPQIFSDENPNACSVM